MPQYDLTINVVGKDKSSGVFSGLSSSLGKIFQIAGGIVAARVFMALADQIGNVVRAAINATAQFQNMQIGLEGLVARELARLTDGAKTIAEVFPDAQLKAAGLMDELSKLAIVSPYMVDAVIQTFRMQMAFGFTTEEASDLTHGLLNMAAGIGATAPMLQRMAYNLAQINLQGKTTKLDIRQLALAGLGLVDVLKYMGDEMGIEIETHLDFNKAIADGAMNWQDFARLFKKYGEENFAGASERMARTLIGLKSTFNDVFVLTMPKVLGPAAEVVTQSINKILDLFIYIRESGILEDVGAQIAGVFEGWLGPFNEFMDRILKFLGLQQRLKDFGRGSATDLMHLRQEMLKLAPTGDIVRDSLEATFGPKAAEWYDKIRIGIGKFIERLEWLGRVAGRAWDVVGVLVGGLGKFWENYGDSIANSVQRIVDALFGFADPRLQAGMEGVEGLAKRISDWLAGEGGAKIAKGVEDFATWIIEDAIPAVSEFIDWLEEKLPLALQSLTDFWNNTLNPALIEFGRVWKEDVMPGFVNLKQFWDENGEAILEVLGKFIENLTGVTLTNAAGNLTSLGEAFESGTASMIEDGPSIVENLGNITTKISNFVDVISDPQTTQIALTLGKIAAGLWAFNQAVTAGAALKGGLVTLIGGITGLSTAIGGLGVTATAMPYILGTLVYALGAVVAAKIDEIMTQLREDIGEWVDELIPDWTVAGEGMLNGFNEGIGTKWAEIVEGVQKAFTDWVTGLLTGDPMAMGPLGPIGMLLNKAGEDLAAGLWEGFEDKWDGFVAWIEEQWAWMENRWNTIWETDSPSGVTKRLGENIGEGLVIGLQGKMNKAQQLLSAYGSPGSFSSTSTHESVTVPITIGNVSSDVDIEMLYQTISGRLRYERSMARR